MKRNPFACWIGPALALVAQNAGAHGVDAASGGLAAGLAHPFLGLDHLLAMLAVGLLAARYGRHARWALPAAFAAATAVGIALAVAGISLPAVETAIALSVVMLGLLVAIRHELSLPAATLLVGALAVFHGFAHGSEMPPAALAAWEGFGFVSGTALLHAAGLACGLAAGRAAPYAGAAIAASGLGLVLGL